MYQFPEVAEFERIAIRSCVEARHYGNAVFNRIRIDQSYNLIKQEIRRNYSSNDHLKLKCLAKLDKVCVKYQTKMTNDHFLDTVTSDSKQRRDNAELREDHNRLRKDFNIDRYTRLFNQVVSFLLQALGLGSLGTWLLHVLGLDSLLTWLFQ